MKKKIHFKSSGLLLSLFGFIYDCLNFFLLRRPENGTRTKIYIYKYKINKKKQKGRKRENGFGVENKAPLMSSRRRASFLFLGMRDTAPAASSSSC